MLGRPVSGLVATLATVLAVPLLVPAGSAAAAGTVYDCSQVTTQGTQGAKPLARPPADIATRLGIPAARAVTPGGAGYRVVILDSGPHNADDPEGDVLAGLVRVVAPAARIDNVQLWGRPPSGGPAVTAAVGGLAQVAGHADAKTIVLLGVPLEAIGHRADAALATLQARGAVVVDPVGQAPRTGQSTAPSAGYDDANPRLPFRDLLTVSVMPLTRGTAADAIEAADSSTAFTVPTYGARSSIGRTACVLTTEQPVDAAALMAGMLALVASSRPGVSLPDWIARLEATATGGAPHAMYVGNGVPQPLAAIRYQPPGKVTPTPPIPPPRMVAPAADVLAGTKHHAVWWGLVGGGALLLALVLRPLLSRRR